ncbi:hypothetical protein F4780DRAFT_544175 [Xylariomycetidae sp. FL0641]|nr:hypothetical protein F4780DRAFT_544175 [Xylariomycetidae sp. FL0641]
MAPIPVYSNSPITAPAKPSGATPQTAAPAPAPALAPSASATPTKTVPLSPGQMVQTGQTGQTAYPAAQPGATPSLPAPTAAAQASTDPLPPRPGATASIPPPPKAGEKYQPPQQTAGPQVPPMPPQVSVPAPTASYSSLQRGTSTAPVAPAYGQPYSAVQNLHPPGYQQSTTASAYQSPAVQQSEYENSEGFWDSAKKAAQQAGEKLAAAEKKVWDGIGQLNKQ